MKNEYLPARARIERIVDEGQDAKTFVLRLEEKKGPILRYKPGQFLMLSLAGYGEAPFTFASLPHRDGSFEISVRKIGSLTNALHDLRVRDRVGIRAPYGNAFPLDAMENKDLLFVAGGCGIAPLRSLIQYVFARRRKYGKVEITYGCRTPRDRFYKEEISDWARRPSTEVHCTVDEPDESWKGECGVVCTLFPKIRLDPRTSMVFLCGPSVMLKAAIRDIRGLGFRDHAIYASLERYMKCGIGKCGHCYVKGKYVCLDGPNFSYAEMKKMGIDS